MKAERINALGYIISNYYWEKKTKKYWRTHKRLATCDIKFNNEFVWMKKHILNAIACGKYYNDSSTSAVTTAKAKKQTIETVQ